MTQPSNEPQRSLSITITRDIPEKLLKDILTTTVEGGSLYWLNSETDAEGVESVTYDGEGDDYGVSRIKGIHIQIAKDKRIDTDATLDTIFEGIRKIVSTEPIKYLSDSMRKRIAGALLGDPDDFFVGEDALTADLILQVGLFGEVVFG